MPDFYEAFVDPPSGLDPLADNDLVPWTILLPPSGPLRTDLGRFPSERAEARERERQQLAATEDAWERAAHRTRTSVRPAGGREEWPSAAAAPPVESLFPRQAELRNFEPSLRQRMAWTIGDVLRAGGMKNYNANKLGYDLTDLASFAPPVGIPIAVDDFKRAAERGDVPEALWAAAGATPPGRLPMNRAARMARAKKQGYSDERFYRGERSGETPMEFGSDTFFSRQREYSDAFAKVGGKEAADEYRLALKDPFKFGEPVTAEAYARIVRQMQVEDPKRAVEMVNMVLRGASIPSFERFAKQNPGVVVARPGAHVYYLVKGGRPDEFAYRTFKKAGFDALDFGRDVLKFEPTGIRSKNAVFDPKRVDSTDIMAGVLPPLAAGAMLTMDPEEDWSPDPDRGQLQSRPFGPGHF